MNDPKDFTHIHIESSFFDLEHWKSFSRSLLMSRWKDADSFTAWVRLSGWCSGMASAVLAPEEFSEEPLCSFKEEMRFLSGIAWKRACDALDEAGVPFHKVM